MSSGPRYRSVGFVLFLLLPVIGVAAFALGESGGPGEAHVFGPAGADLIQGRWGSVFRRPDVQAGPWELAPFGLLEILHVDDTLGLAAWGAAFCILLVIGVLTAVQVVARPAAAPHRERVALGAMGILLVLGGIIPRAIDVGHPAQVVIGAMWVVAAALARAQRPLLAGAALAFAAGWEVWGALGCAVLLTGTAPADLRRAAQGALVAALGTMATFVPFAVAGRFEMLHFAWPVSPGSWFARLYPDERTFPWSWRLGQAVIALSIGIAVSLLLRRRPEVVFLAPWAVLTARLCTDPCQYPYYWIAPEALLTMLAGWGLLRRDVPLAGAAAAACIALWASDYLPGLDRAVALLVSLLGLLVLVMSRRWATQQSLVQTPPP